nr:unnamed protein product [Spirometra erinaceieuropaei]
MAARRKTAKLQAEEQVSLKASIEPQEIVFGVCHIYASFNDTFVHVTDSTCSETIVRVTGGMKVRADREESSPYAAMLAAQDVAERCKALGISALHVRIRATGGTKARTPSPAAQSALRSLKLPTSNASTQKSQRIVLNSSDPLFGEICDQNFASVAPILSKRTKELSAILNETKASKELATLKRLVGQLPELRQLHASASQHMDLAETLQEYAGSEEFLADFRTQQDFLAGFETDKAHPLIEQRILQLAPIEEVLRLICVQSFCNGGLKQRLLDFYRHEILQSYGFEHMLTLDNLERLGLLGECSRIANLPQTSPTLQSPDLLDRDRASDVRRTVAAVSSVYASSLRRSLRLQVAPDPPNAPSSLDGSLSHLLGGTVPISVRLVQAMALGWPSRALNTLTTATISGGTPIGGALSAASNMANSALQAGRRLVSGGTVGSPVLATTSSSGGYVTSLLHTVEVDELQVPGEFSKPTVGEGVATAKIGGGAGTGGRDVTRTVVVAFVGGVTHSEVAALRKIAASDEGRVDFIIVTTGFLSWNSFIQSLSEPINVAELTS